jgi:hypothetical protein
MTLAARDADDRAEQLLLLTKRLTDLIERETSLFRARRPLEAAPFRDEKAKLANLYRQETAQIAREPALVAGARLENRQALNDATVRLYAVLDEHRQAIEALQEISEGLVKAIAGYVAELRAGDAAYGPAGERRAPNAGSAITLDRTA